MRVLLDTNVVLDVLLQRLPWLTQADAIWQASRSGLLDAYMTASSVTDVYHVVRRAGGLAAASAAVRRCLDDLAVVPVDEIVLEHAWSLPITDFEDALQAACTIREGLDAIVTRDVAGFVGAGIVVLSPADLIARLPPPSVP